MPRDFENLDAFRAAAGEELGTSDWLTPTGPAPGPPPSP